MAEHLGLLLGEAQKDPVRTTQSIESWEQATSLDIITDTLCQLISPATRPFVGDDITFIAISLLKRVLKTKGLSSPLPIRISVAETIHQKLVTPLDGPVPCEGLLSLFSFDATSEMLMACFKASLQSLFPLHVPSIVEWVTGVMTAQATVGMLEENTQSSELCKQIRTVQSVLVHEVISKVAASVRFGPNKASLDSHYSGLWIKLLTDSFAGNPVKSPFSCHLHLLIFSRILAALLKMAPYRTIVDEHDRLSFAAMQSLDSCNCLLKNCPNSIACPDGYFVSWRIVTSLQLNILRGHRQVDGMTRSEALLTTAIQFLSAQRSDKDTVILRLMVARFAAQIFSVTCLSEDDLGKTAMASILSRLSENEATAQDAWMRAAINITSLAHDVDESLVEDNVIYRACEVLSFSFLLPLLRHASTRPRVMGFLEKLITDPQSYLELKFGTSMLLLYVEGRRAEFEEFEDADWQDDMIESRFVLPFDGFRSEVIPFVFSDLICVDLLSSVYRVDTAEGGDELPQTLALEMQLMKTFVSLQSFSFFASMTGEQVLELLSDGLMLLSGLGSTQWSNMQRHAMECVDIYKLLIDGFVVDLLPNLDRSDVVVDSLSALVAICANLIELWHDEYKGYVWWSTDGSATTLVLQRIVWNLVLGDASPDLFTVDNVSSLLDLSEGLDFPMDDGSEESNYDSIRDNWLCISSGWRRLISKFEEMQADALLQWLPLLGRYNYFVAKFLSTEVIESVEKNNRPQLRDLFNNEICPLLREVADFFDRFLMAHIQLMNRGSGASGRLRYFEDEIQTWQSLIILLLLHSSDLELPTLEKLFAVITNPRHRDGASPPCTTNKLISSCLCELISTGVQLSGHEMLWCRRATTFGVRIASASEFGCLGIRLWGVGLLNGDSDECLQSYRTLIEPVKVNFSVDADYRDPDKCSELLSGVSVTDSLRLRNEAAHHLEILLHIHSIISWFPLVSVVGEGIDANDAFMLMNRMIAAYVSSKGREVIRGEAKGCEAKVEFILHSYLSFLNSSQYFDMIHDSSILFVVQAMVLWNSALIQLNQRPNHPINEGTQRRGGFSLRNSTSLRNHESDSVDSEKLCHNLQNILWQTIDKRVNEVGENAINVSIMLMNTATAIRASKSLFCSTIGFRGTLESVLMSSTCN
eukprot:GHVH01012120.1.p1 GENE.GHVH01012120.1~~GHVH01012120.1.p1  ORF type:complete len:1162 (+),score=164.38 GHVH01012120.1:25-3486(+)